ncbi:nitrate- and nitrite sensing domain-containing protein [Spongiactinospora sp. TRM90649]|uniref:sensor histidine kinase n=1 Tax=Spongiactinospora sp. TRM90649 TaxID=3031114 RepID=UPI0023F6F53F|nr:nitrate- and nitrite sensing domain-containing protein [Spongiactinospora sp. TRM90649]
MVALWAFAVGLTGGDGARLMEISALADSVADPSEQVVIELQRERLASVKLLRAPHEGDVEPSDREGRAELNRQRQTTDSVVAAFRARAASPETGSAVPAAMRPHLDRLLQGLSRLPALRVKVDGGGADALSVIQGYSGTITNVYRMYDSMVLVPDFTMYQQGRAVSALGEVKEILARERALITGVALAGRMTSAERLAFREMVATRRFLHSWALADLGAELSAPHQRLAASPVYTRFATIEDRIKSAAPGLALSAQEAGSWVAGANALWTAVERNQARTAQLLVGKVDPAANEIIVQIAVAGGIGLLAVAVSVLISARFGGRLVRELAQLRDAARELADVRLRGLVERLRSGDPDPKTPEPLTTGGHTAEIDGIARAFTSVQRTAVDAAVEQATLRGAISKIFVNLARRNQALLHRQLAHLDGMQRKTEDPEVLGDLFRLDHLTTRMRRHAENLIILSGEVPGRGWSRPIPIMDVLRAAVAEVEGYARVHILPAPNGALAGQAVADTIHLIAELVENATLYSPPQTNVQVRSEPGVGVLLVHIEDRGLGLPPSQLDSVNRKLASGQDFDLADTEHLGLFVVARLAVRHGIGVSLAPSAYGGITATVSIPAVLVVPQTAPALHSADTGVQ